MQNNKSSGQLRRAKRNGKSPRKSRRSCAYKSWLTRREIEAEYGLSLETIKGLEQAKKLNPVRINIPDKELQALGDRQARIKLYARWEVDLWMIACAASSRGVNEGPVVQS